MDLIHLDGDKCLVPLCIAAYVVQHNQKLGLSIRNSNSFRNIWSNFTLNTAALSSKREIVILFIGASFTFPMGIEQ